MMRPILGDDEGPRRCSFVDSHGFVCHVEGNVCSLSNVCEHVVFGD
jgi:hypothetical protein